MFNYCTSTDTSFLPRVLALHGSLVRHAPSFRLWVLCFGDETIDLLQSLDLPYVVPFDEDALGVAFRRLRDGRSRREYYFTAKPAMVLHLLPMCAPDEKVTLLDGDMYCLSDPTPVHASTDESSVALTPHGFDAKDKKVRFGIYNAGFATFANDHVGRAAARWWLDRCVESCPDYPIDGRFADQKYLEMLPSLFPRVTSIEHRGVNLGPWNLARSGPLETSDGSVQTGGDPVIFFHFQGLTKWGAGLYDPGRMARRNMRVLREAVYRPYVAELSRYERFVQDTLAPRGAGDIAPWGWTVPRPWWWRMSRTIFKRISAAASFRLVSARGISRV